MKKWGEGNRKFEQGNRKGNLIAWNETKWFGLFWNENPRFRVKRGFFGILPPVYVGITGFEPVTLCL